MVEENTAKAYIMDEMIAEFQNLPADFAPGENFTDNNSAYLLVGAVFDAERNYINAPMPI